MDRFTAESFLNVQVFERLNGEFSRLMIRRQMRGMSVVGIALLGLSAGEGTAPTADFINRVERNLDGLAAGLGISDLGTKVWLGEDRDERWLDFNDVNRWFESLERIGHILG